VAEPKPVERQQFAGDRTGAEIFAPASAPGMYQLIHYVATGYLQYLAEPFDDYLCLSTMKPWKMFDFPTINGGNGRSWSRNFEPAEAGAAQKLTGP
jgi:hypothetical protein